MYSSVFLGRCVRRLGTVQHMDSYIQQHDDNFARCAAQIAQKIAAESTQTAFAAHYLRYPYSTTPDIWELQGFLCPLLELLTGDERYALMLNIQVDFAAGERQVAFGGTFEGNSAIFQQAKKINAKSKHQYKERHRAAQNACRPISKAPTTRFSRAASKK